MGCRQDSQEGAIKWNYDLILAKQAAEQMRLAPDSNLWCITETHMRAGLVNNSKDPHQWEDR